jgi:hypothetical protein
MFLCLLHNTQLTEKPLESPYKVSAVYSFHWQHYPNCPLIKIAEKNEKPITFIRSTDRSYVH